MTRQEAVRQVAEHLAAILASSDLEEATGADTESLSDADCARLEWAVATVERRLLAMGRRRNGA